jgi:hypothetical protein
METKLPRGKVTVTDLICNDHIKSSIEEIKQRAWDVSYYVFITEMKNGDVGLTFNGSQADVVYLIEKIKHQLLEKERLEEK